MILKLNIKKFLNNNNKKINIYFKILKYILILIIAIVMIYFYKSNFLVKYFRNYYYELTVKSGFALRNVYLEGQNHTDSKILVDTLDLDIGRSIFSISLDNLKTNLESIDWIKYAIIERSFPDTLYIGIVEKKPIAIWQKSGKFFLVDDSGGIICDDDLHKFTDYVIIIGDDAPLHYKALSEIISKDKKLFEQISHAIRISDRRWNIKFHNGLEIKLPESDTDQAWNYVIELFNKKNLFGKSVSTIDLRIANKLYVR